MQIAVKHTPHHESILLDTLRRASTALVAEAPEREARLCAMFGAKRIRDASAFMAHGWERPVDAEIQTIIASLLRQGEHLSILEIAAGSTWGTGERNFGVPGLARAIQRAFPTRTRVAVCDRAEGYDIFFHAGDGELVRSHYDDAETPKLLWASDIRHNGAFIPAPPPFIQASVTVDKKFADWLGWHERTYNTNILDGSSALFIRPTLDPEIEARLFGVRVVPGFVDYLNLVECLTKAGEVARYDLIFGRHLLPQYFPSRISHLKEVLPDALQACARNSLVQFDRCFFGEDDYADLVFEHREYHV